jgi:hypothetical protein
MAASKPGAGFSAEAFRDTLAARKKQAQRPIQHDEMQTATDVAGRVTNKQLPSYLQDSLFD